MNHTQRAIELAVEGGWKYQNNRKTDFTVREHDLKIYFNDENDTKIYIGFYEVLLDSFFWKSIGKALDWEERKECGCCNKEKEFCRCWHYEIWEEWKNQWHSFIDILASGQTPDDFFATILPADK